MDQTEAIEIQIWEYLDGGCTLADRQRIAALVVADAEWKKQYEELSDLHQSIPAVMELEQPSLRFTKDVMDAVAKVHIAPATKQYINKSIIRSIAAFFIITITTLLGYALSHTNQQTATSIWSPIAKLQPHKIDTSALFTSGFFNIIIAINVLLGLILMDKMLRRNKREKVV